MITLERARQCIGRSVRHVDNLDVRGTVARVDNHDVWVTVGPNEVVPCMPENLDWVPMIHEKLAEAIEGGYGYEDAQIGYDYDDGGEIGIIYSPGSVNDDDLDHLLIAIFPMVQKVVAMRPTTNPWSVAQIEELLGYVSE